MSGENSVITLYRRKMLTKITSGVVSTIPKVTHIAFGEGGIDEEGSVIAPLETQTKLKSEFCRYYIDSATYPIETTARYTVTVPREEQAGKSFSEMGLIDADGNLCAVKNMLPKVKDEDVIFTFEFDDEF